VTLAVEADARNTMKRRAISPIGLLALLGVASGAAPTTPEFFARRDYTGLYSQWVQVGDTNGDGIPDLITNGIEVLFGNGDGTFRLGPTSVVGPTYTAGFVAAHLGGSGRLDAVFSGGPNGLTTPLGIGVSLGNGDGTFQPMTFYPAGSDTGIGNPIVGDFNGDGIPDVAVAGSSGVWLFAGRGDGTFSPNTVHLKHFGGILF
jgi:hypothetical protein